MTIQDQGQTLREMLVEEIAAEVAEFGSDSPVAIMLQQQLDASNKAPDYPFESRIVVRGSRSPK